MLSNFAKMFSTLIKNCNNHSLADPTVSHSIIMTVKGDTVEVESSMIVDDILYDDSYVVNRDVSHAIIRNVDNSWQALADTLSKIHDLVVRNCISLGDDNESMNKLLRNHDNGCAMDNNVLAGFTSGFLTASFVFMTCYFLKKCADKIVSSRESSNSHTTTQVCHDKVKDLKAQPNPTLEGVEVTCHDNKCFVLDERNV